MSRLDSFIRRMSAQRDCLNWAAQNIKAISGPVLELGLGNGRTYDHLRTLLPEREIYVFDRRIAAHPACIPDDDHMFLGDITETLSRAHAQLGAHSCALIHSDIGTGDETQNAILAAAITPHIAALLAGGGLILADQQLPLGDGFQTLPVPDGVPDGRYFLFKKEG